MALDEEAGVLHLEVEDYGRGIREDDRAGVGRHSMRERRGAGWYYQSAVGRGCHQRPALIEVADLEYLLKDMVSDDFDGNPDGNVARKRPEKVGLRDDSDTQKTLRLQLKQEKTGKYWKWRDPDSNRGHHDFQSSKLCPLVYHPI